MSSIIVNFCKMYYFQSVCNKNIQYLLYNLGKNISIRGENRRGKGALS